MVAISHLFVASVALASVHALPLRFSKRIAQVIVDATADWEKACLAAGGAQQCNPISQTAFTALLAAGKNCDQQDAADKMIDLAKSLGSDAEMIRLAQLYVQQPRNAPDSLQVPYCQSAPKNAQLAGLFHCQFAGSNFAKFSGDQSGNLPLGVAAVNPAGSCPANPAGPVPDGQQLNKLVQSPGEGAAAGGAAKPAPPPPAQSAPPPPAATTVVAAAPPPPAQTQAAPAAPPPATDKKAFQKQNGIDAAALNAKFAGLSASSACTDGEVACVGDSFAQCVGGKFAVSACAGGLVCRALPLVNKPGTSVTCDTAADADARIAETGASAADTAAAPAAPAPAPAPAAPKPADNTAAAPAAPAPAGDKKAFQKQNGIDAAALNAKFQSLSASSACTDGEVACVGDAFAQCVGGKFATTACSGGLVCRALPLVNKAGTSVTCDTAADADARIATSGA